MTYDYIYEIYSNTMVKVKVNNEGDIIYQKLSKGTPSKPKVHGDLKLLRKNKNKKGDFKILKKVHEKEDDVSKPTVNNT